MAKKKRGVSAASKDMLRAVWKSRSRFLAIFGIVALGAGFFCGLLSCGPDMRDTVDQYADDSSVLTSRSLPSLTTGPLPHITRTILKSSGLPAELLRKTLQRSKLRLSTRTTGLNAP